MHKATWTRAYGFLTAGQQVSHKWTPTSTKPHGHVANDLPAAGQQVSHRWTPTCTKPHGHVANDLPAAGQ